MSEELENTVVHNLMVEGGKVCDNEVLNDICNERDPEVIKRISLSMSNK